MITQINVDVLSSKFQPSLSFRQIERNKAEVPFTLENLEKIRGMVSEEHECQLLDGYISSLKFHKPIHHADTFLVNIIDDDTNKQSVKLSDSFIKKFNIGNRLDVIEKSEPMRFVFMSFDGNNRIIDTGVQYDVLQNNTTCPVCINGEFNVTVDLDFVKSDRPTMQDDGTMSFVIKYATNDNVECAMDLLRDSWECELHDNIGHTTEKLERLRTQKQEFKHYKRPQFQGF